MGGLHHMREDALAPTTEALRKLLITEKHTLSSTAGVRDLSEETSST